MVTRPPASTPGTQLSTCICKQNAETEPNWLIFWGDLTGDLLNLTVLST